LSADQPEPKSDSASWWRAWRNWLKLIFALTSGLFCCAIAAFAPSEGPSLRTLIPPNASLVFHIRDGQTLYAALAQTQAFSEVVHDPDSSALLRLKSPDNSRRAPADIFRETLESLGGEKLSPWQRSLVKWFIPPEPEGLFPYAGRDSALILLPTPVDDGPLLLGEKPRRPAPPMLVFTRVSGVRGLGLRLVIFARSFKTRAQPASEELFDLGGGLVALGRRGARPSFETPVTDGNSSATAKTPLPVARLTLGAELWKSQLAPLENSGVDTLKFQGVPDEVIAAIVRPPPLQQLFAIKNPPSSVILDFFGDGRSLTARGLITGAHLPALPKVPLSSTGNIAQDNEPPIGEGFLPLDLRAFFLRHVASEMASSRGQRRWLARFDDLDSIDADLETLWPVFGQTIHFSINSPPRESDTMGYALVNGTIPFDGSKIRARGLLRDFARTFPEIRPQRARGGDRFVFESSSIFRPAITVTERELLITSNAGPAIFRDALPETAPVVSAKTPPPSSYFIRFDGERLSPTAEKGMVVHLDELEEKIGTREFMAQYPEPEVYVRLARKLTRLLGKFSLKIQPLENADARINIEWTPASIVAPDAPKKPPAEDVAAPPPAL